MKEASQAELEVSEAEAAVEKAMEDHAAIRKRLEEQKKNDSDKTSLRSGGKRTKQRGTDARQDSRIRGGIRSGSRKRREELKALREKDGLFTDDEDQKNSGGKRSRQD